jgi:hypothetical protein
MTGSAGCEIEKRCEFKGFGLFCSTASGLNRRPLPLSHGRSDQTQPKTAEISRNDAATPRKRKKLKRPCILPQRVQFRFLLEILVSRGLCVITLREAVFLSTPLFDPFPFSWFIRVKSGASREARSVCRAPLLIFETR